MRSAVAGYLFSLISGTLLALPLGAQPYGAVDDATLRNPPPGEWLTYGLNYAETRFSPLTLIDRGNVQRLRQAWTWDIPGEVGLIEATPLLHDGVLYGAGTWGFLYALDARTGRLKWKWDPAVVRGGRAGGGQTVINGATSRGVALYDGKVYAGLTDGRLVALDAETGDLVWVRMTLPYGNSEYMITGAPRVYNGNVIIGNGGAEFHGVRGYVTAYDAQTGDAVWRFHTVPGDPSLGFESPAMEMAAETWEGEWWKYGGGGTAWDSFSFDPEANLVYIGTGNGSPWSHFWRSNGIGDNLFLCSIVAVDADTGEYVWHYQIHPGENWDYTCTMNILQADLVIGGRDRKVLMQAPKNGFLYVIDRHTGELISAEKITEHVNWATHIDLETGRPVETAIARYDTIGAWIRPGGRGAHNWDPMSFSPLTGLVYIPGQNNQSFHRLNPSYEPTYGQFSTGTIRGAPTIEAPPPPLPAGFLVARDPVTQQDRWRIEYETGSNGGTMVTASNVLFSGRRDGRLLASDAETGRLLWEAEISRAPVAPITYLLDGRQYVTVLTGPPAGVDGAAGRVYTFVLNP
jgi:quinohemoprotein ethanol dehydrogenase